MTKSIFKTQVYSRELEKFYAECVDEIREKISNRMYGADAQHIGNYKLSEDEQIIYGLIHGNCEFSERDSHDILTEYVKEEIEDAKTAFEYGVITTVLKERAILKYNDVEWSRLYNKLYDEYHHSVLERCKNGELDSEFKSEYESIVSGLDSYMDTSVV